MVSLLGFGGMRFIEPKNLDKSVHTVLRAFELGVNYFDTAPYYTDDKSEIIMGLAVQVLKKSGKPFYLSTKSGKTRGDAVRKELEKSLKRLNLNTIDFYHIWCLLSLEDWEERKKGGVLAALRRAQEEGLIRHLCFSAHLAGHEIREVLEAEAFAGFTIGYSAINFAYREEALRLAANKKLGVAIMNPLGGGIIPANPERFAFIKTKAEQTVVEAALHFIFSQEPVSVVLVGFRDVQDVESAVAAVNNFVPYTTAQVQTLKEKIHRDFDTLCTGCGYCRDCPEKLAVWKFMEAFNHTLLEGSDSVYARLRWHWAVPITELDRCTRCRRCEKACTQHLPILERMAQLKELYRHEEQARFKHKHA
jgi:predicted aldo/keto reductase-like oxidoreductase